MQPVAPAIPKLIDLNVQGTKVTTEERLLTKFPDTLLAAQVSGTAPALRDQKQRLYLNTDPISFRHLLAYLRDGHLPALSEKALQRLRAEANVLGFRDLLAVEEARTKACNEPLPHMPSPARNDNDSDAKVVSGRTLEHYYAWSDALWHGGCHDASSVVFASAVAYENSDYTSAARSHYEALLKKNAEDLLAMCRVAYLECSQRDEAPDEAIALARQALVRGPTIAECVIVTATALLLSDDSRPCFTAHDLEEATRVLGLRARKNASCDQPAVDEFVRLLATTDLIAATQLLHEKPFGHLRALATSLSELAQTKPDDSMIETGRSLPIHIRTAYKIVQEDEFSQQYSERSVNRAIAECAKRLHIMANTQEALAIFREGLRQNPTSVALWCAFAEALLKAQESADLMAFSSAPTMQDSFEAAEAQQTAVEKSCDESEESSISGTPIVLGSGGAAFLREGIDAFKHIKTLPAIGAAHPFDPIAAVAVAYAEVAQSFPAGSSPATEEANGLLETLRKLLAE